MDLTHGKIYQWLDRDPLNITIPNLDNKRIVVTGSSGFIGRMLSDKLLQVHPYDIDLGDDILDAYTLNNMFEDIRPEIVFHLAAHKYATTAEEIPAQVAELNIIGTHNVVEAAARYDAKVVLASTCKAVEPCTAYGASKLIAEKVVLNYWNGRVFRLVNVIGSTGSVIDIWNKLPKDAPLPVTAGWRYYISPDEAVRYLLACTDLESGIYAPDPGLVPRYRTSRIALHYAPERKHFNIPLRRGDRCEERLIGEYEGVDYCDNSMIKISEPWAR